jgi:hypothetical protein
MIDENKLKENEENFSKIYGDSFISDGITDINIYNDIKPKILWILKEPNDISESSWDQRDFHKDVSTYNDWRRTYKLIIKTTYAIFNNIKEFDNIPDEYNIRNILHKIAFINIKKKGGGAQANEAIIRNTYYRDKELILEQIDLINPDIIINCSRVWNFFIDLVSTHDTKPDNEFQYGFKDNKLIIHAYHPNNTTTTNEKYFNNIMQYIDIYNNGTRANDI